MQPTFSPTRTKQGQPTSTPSVLTVKSPVRVGEKTKPIPFDIVPPHDIEIERACIGAMLIASFAAEYAAEILTPDAFYGPRNRFLYLKCVSVYRTRKALDETLLCANLTPPNNGNDIKDYIARLIIDTPAAGNIEGYASMLLKLQHERRRLAFALSILTDVLKHYSGGGPGQMAKPRGSGL